MMLIICFAVLVNLQVMSEEMVHIVCFCLPPTVPPRVMGGWVPELFGFLILPSALFQQKKKIFFKSLNLSG